MAEEYKPNSHRSKEQSAQRRVEKVVTGEVRQRRRTGLSRAGNLILPGDMNSVKDYILTDVLGPSIRRAISDIVCNGINMLLGEPNRPKTNPAGAKVSYRQYYQDRDERRDPYGRPRAQAAYSYDDVLFDNRGDAEEVLYRMEELIDNGMPVSIADLMDMAGLRSNYTDNKYGWTDVSSAYVERTRDGDYIIRLPRPTML